MFLATDDIETRPNEDCPHCGSSMNGRHERDCPNRRQVMSNVIPFPGKEMLLNEFHRPVFEPLDESEIQFRSSGL